MVISIQGLRKKLAEDEEKERQAAEERERRQKKSDAEGMFRYNWGEKSETEPQRGPARFARFLYD